MRLPYNYKELILMLGKLIMDLEEVENNETKNTIMINIATLLKTIIDCAPEALNLLKDMNEKCKSEQIKNVIKEVI